MVKRFLKNELQNQLKRGKSILLLGPRQTGKTTLIKSFDSDLYLNLAINSERRRFELNPDLIIKEIAFYKNKTPLIIIDEIQKVPQILDPIQVLIDEKKAQFILTGSSARKLRKQSEINLLPGRVVSLHMDPLSQTEYKQDLEDHLLFGSLPGIALLEKNKDKNTDLRSYVDIYLEEEVRAEAIVRNLPAFYKFLEYVALESGKIVSFLAMSKSIGVAHTTISSYYEVLEDCLMVHKIDPYSQSTTRKKLTKSSKYLFFDLGVRRLAANEGTKISPQRMGELFENYVGLELYQQLRTKNVSKLLFWRDPNGPEVDWLIETSKSFIPIEVKMKSNPDLSDCKHLKTFMTEHDCKEGAFVVCSTPRPYQINDNITAIPWQNIDQIIDLCE